jgi:cell division inhibitor SepF
MASVVQKLKEFFGFVEEDLNDVKPHSEPTPILKPFKSAIMGGSSSRHFMLAEIKIEEPRIYEDSLAIAGHLRENKPVIINLKYLDSASGKRLIDFMCGTAYAINGHMMKIGENIFLFTPENVLIAEQSDKNTFEQGVAQQERDIFFKQANG